MPGAGADPDRFPPFHGNRSTSCPSDSKYPKMALRGVKTTIFPGRVILEARTIGAHVIRKRSPFFLDPHLRGVARGGGGGGHVEVSI